MGKGRLGDDEADLARRLFAVATAMLEDAIEIAVAGQSPRLGPARLAAQGRLLEAAARDISVVAEAAAIVAKLGAKPGQNRRKSAP